MSVNLLNEFVMEIKNEAGLAFRAHFPNGVTAQECFDALKTFAEKIVEISNENKAKQEAAQAAQPAQSTEAQG